MKSAQAASEIKPTLQQIYINKFNHKLKSMGKATNSKEKPSKPWWLYPYSTESIKFMRRLKTPLKTLQQQEKFLDTQIMSSTFSPINNQNKNVNLSPDMEIIKITTVVEAIRQKRQNSEQMLEVSKNIQKIFGKKRSKRSLYEPRNNSTVTKNKRRAQQEKTFISNKKSRSKNPKPNYRKQQLRIAPTRKVQNNNKKSDLKAANDAAIPSVVFYKRIWEYINGTRPHFDIISDYNSLENDSEKNNSTCTDKDRIAASQSQEDKLQVTDPNVKPERDFYKRIWDIINATQLNGHAKARSKRNANILKNNGASTPLCVQEEIVKEDELQSNEKTSLDITGTINSPEISDSDPYLSGFWAIANKTQWQPNKIPVVNIAKLNNGPILSSLVNSASEVDDLNKLPDKVEHVAYSSSDNSTGHNNELRKSPEEAITEPGPPYSSEESFAISSSVSTESTVDKDSQEKAQAERAENYSSTTPNYDPLNIPYVDVPDYSDQQEESLDKSNQSATPAGYKEYDDSDYDYIPKRLHDANDFSSKSQSADIKVAQAESNEPETSLNANNSRSSCTESKDSAECVDNYDVKDTKLRNNTEDVTNDDINSSTESALSEENENSDFVDFDINEYKKPFNWKEFFKNDPILESIQATFNKDYHKENPNSTEKSEEETYATDPEEKSYDYFAKNEDSRGDYGIALDNRNKTEEETDFSAKKNTKESETIDKDHYHYPYDDKDLFNHVFEKDNDKESEHDKKNSDRTEQSEEVETYATDPKEHSQDYFVKNEDYDREKTNNKEDETDFYAKKETKESETTDEDDYPYDDQDFFKHIFGNDNNKESSDIVDAENEFLSSHFTEDVLRQLQDNSTTEEDRRREESRNREDIQKTLSKILDEKDRFSRLDDNLNTMIEKGEAIPIKYNNFWSLEYESPRKKNENNEEKIETSKEEA